MRWKVALFCLLAVGLLGVNWAGKKINIAELVTSTAADPADTGVIRLGNAELICWEASPSGVDTCLTVTAAEVMLGTGTGIQAGNLACTAPPCVNSTELSDLDSYNWDGAHNWTGLGDNPVDFGNAPRVVRVAQSISEGETILADNCHSIKLIATDDLGAVTTNTTNTFTAPSISNRGCIMQVCNSGLLDNITLDDNANFSTGADVVLEPETCVTVGSTGVSGIWYRHDLPSGLDIRAQSIQDIDGPGTNWSIPSSGAASFVSVTTDPVALPTVTLKDSDMAGIPDDNVALIGNCPTGTTAGGDEDCDATLAVQSDGTQTGMLMLDTDADASAVTSLYIGATTTIGTPPTSFTLFSEAGEVFHTVDGAEAITGGAVITADACGSIKLVTAASPVTTNTINTFTAPADKTVGDDGNEGCIMYVCNSGSNTITLDENANFTGAGAVDVPLPADDCVQVGSTGAGGVWYQLAPVQAN